MSYCLSYGGKWTKDDDSRRKYIKKNNGLFADIVDTPKRVLNSIINKNFRGYNKQRLSIS